MDGRIGELEIEYRTTPGHALAPALTPALDRAIHAGLGGSLDELLLERFGSDPTVIVIREVQIDLRVRREDWALDRRCVDQVARASVNVVGKMLASPASGDEVMRFEDQADFVSAYIIDVLGGTADRWYYGAFRPYEEGGPERRINAVLADHRDDAGRVLGRLARRGRLDAVLTLIGADALRVLVTGPTHWGGSPSSDDTAVLADAAVSLLTALGWTIDARRRIDLRDLASSRQAPPPPAWTDRRRLSAWVRTFANQAADSLRRSGATRGVADLDAARALLNGPLDWLDTEWLEARVDRLGEASLPDAVEREPRTGVEHSALVALAARLRDGRVCLDPRESPDTAVVRLIAAAHDDAVEGPLDRAHVEAIERIADAWIVAVASRTSLAAAVTSLDSVRRDGDSAVASDDLLTMRLAAVRACGPVALDLLQAALSSAAAEADVGEHTEGGGLYLMIRALLDVRLDALANQAGVPLPPLMAGLATKWLQLRAPFDPAVAAWCGDSDADPAALGSLQSELDALEQLLLERLVAQQALGPSATDTLVDSGLSEDSAEEPNLPTSIGRIAWLLMRAWQRWLPGLASASTAFLVANCLRRGARAQVDDRDIVVHLEPAPFDVVLQMTGYLQPIAQVPWLEQRRITFEVSRTPRA